MKISIVIGTLNRPDIVNNLIKNLSKIAKNLDIEILLFDQSSEKNFNSVKNNFPYKSNFKLFHLDNPNTCRYLNLGWQKAKAPIVLYLDDDVEVSKKTILAHLQPYNNPKIMAVAGRVINDNEPVYTSNKIGKISDKGAIIERNFSSSYRSYVQFPYGCNMSFRKKTLENVGGFDEKLKPPIYAYNEVDIGYRISKKWPDSIIFEPDALVYHMRFPKGGTRSFNPKVVASSISFNYGYFIAKNFSFFENIIWLSRRVVYQILKEPKEIINILKGFVKGKEGKNYLWPILLVSFFSLIACLRFWKVPEFFSFNFDEEYQASLAWEQVKHFHKIWIGVSASNLKYYLGPGFTYLNAFLFKLSHGDPISLAYFSVLWGILTMFSIFYVTKNLFSKKPALFASLIYGGSSLLNFFDRRFWNPLPMPFISVWMVYSLAKAQKDTRWFILTAILIGSSFHINLGLMIFWPIIIFYFLKKIKDIKLSTWLLIIASYFLITSPLLVFDIVHNFDNIKAPFRFFLERSEPNRAITSSSINFHISVFLSSLGRIWFLKPYTNIQEEQGLGQHGIMTSANPLMIIFSLIILFYVGYKSLKNININYRILFLSLFLFFLSFALYPGYAAEYYLLGFFALFTIAAGILFQKLPQKLIYVFLIGFIIFNFWTILTSNQEQYGLTTRKKLIQEVMKTVDNQAFVLETYGRDPRKYHPYGGWRYLFKAYGKTPTQSFADEFFGWIYKNELSDVNPTLRVVISENIPYKKAEIPLSSAKIGAFYAYVFQIK